MKEKIYTSEALAYKGCMEAPEAFEARQWYIEARNI
jgi:hypothetical protein